MSRQPMWIAVLLLGTTVACAAAPPADESADVKEKPKDKTSDTSKTKTPKAPRPGSDGPVLAAPPLSPSSPRLEALEPASVGVNTGDVELTISGAQFASDARVFVAGEELRPRAATATQLRVVVPGAKLLAAGSLPVKLQNPPNSGGSSNQLSLTVSSMSAQMSIASISPSRAAAGAGDVTLTASGTGFNNKMRVRFNGSDITTVGSTSSSITATVPATLLRLAGKVSVTIFDPATGSVTSPQSFSIDRAQVAGTAATCANRCADFGYKTDQCFDDWQCAANGCLTQQKCAPACKYRCSDYDYQPNQCSDGWVCTNGCLAPKTCSTSSATSKSATTTKTTCTYACNGDAWSYNVGECKDNYECGADNCLTAKVCASPTSTNTATACEYPCNDAEGFWSYAAGECKSGYECGTDGCLHAKTCAAETQQSTGAGACEYPCNDPEGFWTYAAGECRDGYECGADNCLHQKTCAAPTIDTTTTTTTTNAACTYPCVDPEGAWAYTPGECRDGYCCSTINNCLVDDFGGL
jgi:hypothetical protein